MTLFRSIVNDYLINEGASVRAINNAIDGLHPANIKYNSGGENKATGYRLIYPIAYGLTKAGNPVVRAFETGGDTATRNPGWKFFRTDRIISWKTLPRQFNPQSSELIGGFEQMNKEGDESMSQVYNISPIGNAKAIKDNAAKSGKIKQGPITKQDVDNAGVRPNVVTSINGRYTADDAVDDIISKIGTSDHEKNVDKSPEKDYNLNTGSRINAPDTNPVTKKEVNNGEQNTASGQDKKMYANNEPITKQDAENGGEEIKKSELADRYNDMLTRIDKLNKDEEEEPDGRQT